MTLHENVQRGAEWLDSVRPGWYLEIDPAELDLGDSRRCVLGQIGATILEEHGIISEWSGYALATGSISGGLTQSHLTCVHTALQVQDGVEYPDEFGFDLAGHGTWAELDDLWIAEIKDRVNR